MVLAVSEAPSGAVIDQLSKGEARHLTMLERRIANGLQTFREVGVALLEIRDSKLYRETHATFEAYCADKWALPRATAYNYINSAKVVKVLGDPEELTNEAQARELAVIEDAKVVKQVWKAVEATNEPVTAALIRRVRQEVAPSTASSFVRITDNPTDRLMASITRLGAEYVRWQATKPNIGQRRKVEAAIKAFIQAIG